MKFEDDTISKGQRRALRLLWRQQRKRLPKSASLRLYRDHYVKGGVDLTFKVASIRWHEGYWRGWEWTVLSKGYEYCIVELVKIIASKIKERAGHEAVRLG